MISRVNKQLHFVQSQHLHHEVLEVEFKQSFLIPMIASQRSMVLLCIVSTEILSQKENHSPYTKMTTTTTSMKKHLIIIIIMADNQFILLKGLVMTNQVFGNHLHIKLPRLNPLVSAP